MAVFTVALEPDAILPRLRFTFRRALHPVYRVIDLPDHAIPAFVAEQIKAEVGESGSATVYFEHGVPVGFVHVICRYLGLGVTPASVRVDDAGTPTICFGGDTPRWALATNDTNHCLYTL